MSYRINPNKKITYYNWRFRFILLLVAIIFLALIGRMVDLMVLKRGFLQGQGDARSLRTVEIPAYRGMILDRNGQPLAVSSPVEAIWVNPPSFKPNQTQLKKLAVLLQTKPQLIQQKVKKNIDREFLYLQRGMQPDIAEQIKDLNISGLFLRGEYKRYYPDGEVSAQLLGLTNVDDEGQEGIELAYDKTLGGQPGLRKVVKDRLGNIVENITVLRQPRPGQDVTLSIDRRIQYLAYKSLKDQVTKFDAAAGSVVVLDVKTGEVLAMANAPSYNPNFRTADANGRRNRAVTDIFEPGSTTKPFTVYLGLLSGKYTPTTLIDTAPGWTIIGKHRVQDTSNHGTITVSEVLKYSSNIGVSRIVLSLPPNQLWELLDKVGYGHSTNSGFPGESAGELPVRRYWDPFVLSTLSFGYGLSTTALQVAHAYSAIANFGMQCPVFLLKINQPPICKQVLNPGIDKQLIKMMETVVEEQGGTAVQAQVPGYLVAGKTGTSRMVGPKGYMYNHHNTVFAGFAPASNPRYVVIVYISDPRKISYYAGTVAGPVFAKVMAGTLQIMNVPADDLQG